MKFKPEENWFKLWTMTNKTLKALIKVIGPERMLMHEGDMVEAVKELKSSVNRYRKSDVMLLEVEEAIGPERMETAKGNVFQAVRALVWMVNKYQKSHIAACEEYYSRKFEEKGKQ